ncbi:MULTISPECIES: OmpA family protein [Pacificibacter]|uniref:OmpA family protein n=1 Tax=Pacificibacter TaxID=1042323 RepID=UPI001C091247|nr:MULTISPECIES: OmpA family protein [Pacificibacter]MBU2937283.1 OmpA family protein [Pacificibacter marinus]MDO6615278.1 OmpA family protein [Pacificibacter sp. 1_MG-2023]
MPAYSKPIARSAYLTCFIIHLAAAPLAALDLNVPANMVRTAQREEVTTVQPLPSAAFSGAETPFLSAEGRVVHTAYTISSTSLTPFQLIAPLKEQLESQGYQSVFACADTVCGGFDFRYLLDLLPEPHMHVDLGNFQYLLASTPQGRVAALVTSRARTAGFLQITEITPKTGPTDLSIVESAPSETIDTTLVTQTLGPLAQELSAHGSVALDDLAFETGSSQLGDGPFETLQALAAYLMQTPDAHIVLVGHTDAVGSLEGNIALSRKRANSVRDRLVNRHGVTSHQVSAQGIGYLAPRTNNSTEQGRNINRRVEAVLASTP